MLRNVTFLNNTVSTVPYAADAHGTANFTQGGNIYIHDINGSGLTIQLRFIAAWLKVGLQCQEVGFIQQHKS